MNAREASSPSASALSLLAEMRTTTLLLTILLLPNAVLIRETSAAPAESDAYHLVLPRRAVSAGERVELRLEPPAPAGARVNYGVVGVTHGLGLFGVYRAPYVIPPGTPPAKVSAGFSYQGVRAGASAEIELTPSSVPGAEDCLGPGESFSTAWGDIEYGPNFYVDTLPDVIHRVDPVYPRSDFVRGIEDTLIVNALVCRSGHVLDAYAIPRIVRFDPEPVEIDPKLVDAATAAVKQYLFRPAKSYGQPVAVWVAVLVRFTR